jgi:hypothetical protein
VNAIVVDASAVIELLLRTRRSVVITDRMRSSSSS